MKGVRTFASLLCDLLQNLVVIFIVLRWIKKLIRVMNTPSCESYSHGSALLGLHCKRLIGVSIRGESGCALAYSTLDDRFAILV